MKKINNILQSFHYLSASDLLCSMLPSIKYNMTLAMIAISSITTTLATLMGLKTLTVIAFVVLCVVELVTGVVAAVCFKKEKFKSSKASRFTIKLACILAVFFILNSFKMQYEGDNNIAAAFFEWLYLSVVIFFALEYLVSVLENLSVISGKSNNTLITAIKKKFNKILDLDDEPSEDTI